MNAGGIAHREHAKMLVPKLYPAFVDSSSNILADLVG